MFRANCTQASVPQNDVIATKILTIFENTWNSAKIGRIFFFPPNRIWTWNLEAMNPTQSPVGMCWLCLVWRWNVVLWYWIRLTVGAFGPCNILQFRLLFFIERKTTMMLVPFAWSRQIPGSLGFSFFFVLARFWHAYRSFFLVGFVAALRVTRRCPYRISVKFDMAAVLLSLHVRKSIYQWFDACFGTKCSLFAACACSGNVVCSHGCLANGFVPRSVRWFKAPSSVGDARILFVGAAMMSGGDMPVPAGIGSNWKHANLPNSWTPRPGDAEFN